MKLQSLNRMEVNEIVWKDYDVLLLASGFEERSAHILQYIAGEALPKCICLGFNRDLKKLSRPINDQAFKQRGILPFVAGDSQEYEKKIYTALCVGASEAKAKGRPMRIFVDFSVMTRRWYAHLLTWLKYSTDAVECDVHFAYSHGHYHGNFDLLQLEELAALEGFEGIRAGKRRTVAFFGLGYDKYGTLAVHDQIQADSVICYLATDALNAAASQYVLQQNAELIELSGHAPIFLPLDDVSSAHAILRAQFSKIDMEDETFAIPMGPKTHVLATLLAALDLPNVMCLHPRGSRDAPVQVTASGRVICWACAFR